jgi:hypothetical protein
MLNVPIAIYVERTNVRDHLSASRTEIAAKVGYCAPQSEAVDEKEKKDIFLLK